MQLNRSQGKNALSKKLLFEVYIQFSNEFNRIRFLSFFSKMEIFINNVKTDKRVRCIIIRSLVPGVFCAGNFYLFVGTLFKSVLNIFKKI